MAIIPLPYKLLIMKLHFDERLDQNYDTVQNAYIDELIEHWYSRNTAENTNDWRDEFVQSEYNIYLWN